MPETEATTSALAQTGPVGALPATLDESAVVALDEAAKGTGFDPDLLRATPARDIRLQIEAMVALLEKVDHRRLLARQGMLARMTGADVEARLEFELAGQQVMIAARQLRQAAQNGKRLRMLMAKARADLMAEQSRLEGVIAAARRLLATSPGSDDFVVARFERRLASMMAMHAANILTIQQFNLSSEVLTGLLDRFTDVDTLLLPLWQRNVLALAHAAGADTRRTAAGDFVTSHQNLISYLKQDDAHDLR
ncbi:hypothetical protein [Mesorhizobium sp. NZP2077]|uniref:hypothetical protein n=1 Tax=Mesorhizobium sp. NZP2077 TaxID=2483404 RepID=UPI0015536DAD|nr:hypothetical protein [Mesorhizobium sp. NZP2077]QKC82809.1 hypothetical protein EB232_15370 [Mesorhizobium sp. NZP2077]QKD16306.1 hypothetical protein HGP13_15170 [Mesorhizobium sp. NZP2077]